MDSLISVIVPVFNSGQYLTRCIDSILAQDYKPLEIIIVDDGSTDRETKAVCDALSEKSSVIRVFHKENGGTASARNFGIKQAQGDYVGFVDSDDTIEPNMYSTLYRDLLSHNVRIVLGEYITLENGRMIDRRETLPSGEYLTKQLLHHFFLGQWHSACTNLYDRSLFRTVLFPVGEVNEDYILNYWLFKDQEKIYYNNTVFYHYLRRNGSNTSSLVTIHFLDWIRHTSLIRQEYGGEGSLKEEAVFQYLFSNIVLGNKCLLTLGKSHSEEAIRLYRIVTENLKKERKGVFQNSFLRGKYRLFGILLSFCPGLYKAIAISILRVRN